MTRRSLRSFGAEALARPGRTPRGDRAQRSLPVAGVLGAYSAVGAAAAALSLLLGRNPLVCQAWLGTRGVASVALSVGLGLCLGATTLAATRAIVRWAEWARALHLELRSAVHGATDGALWSLAAASAVGEELLFRGLLVPLLGVVVSSIVFGVLHQIRGPARWGWMAWATLMGLLFAIVFCATGSLAGPIAAHLAINHVNLRFLRDNDPAPRPRVLGGLLNR